jgi:hypothetical protein
MSGNVILDVAIGLFFVYLLLSLICSAIQEFLAGILNWRAKNLEAGIRNLLADPNAAGVADAVLKHPLIARLAKPGKLPSYIPSTYFALALMDSLKKADAKGTPMALASQSVAELPDGTLKTALTNLIEDGQGDVDRIRSNIEHWFDNKMDRASGWYKRKAKLVMLVIGFVLAIGLNVDSIHVAQALWKDQGLRDAIVAQAQADMGGVQSQSFTILKGELDGLKLPIGWDLSAGKKDDTAGQATSDKACMTYWLIAFLGWLITAICVSLGAPFWFDALGNALKIRSSGNRPERSGGSA